MSPLVPTVVVEPFDQLAGGLRLVLWQRRVGDLGVDHSLELVARAEAPPSGESDPGDIARLLRVALADREQGVLGGVALDPHLLPDGARDRREQVGIERAMLARGPADPSARAGPS